MVSAQVTFTTWNLNPAEESMKHGRVGIYNNLDTSRF